MFQNLELMGEWTFHFLKWLKHRSPPTLSKISFTSKEKNMHIYYKRVDTKVGFSAVLTWLPYFITGMELGPMYLLMSDLKLGQEQGEIQSPK
jgi:hypothetical protein